MSYPLRPAAASSTTSDRLVMSYPLRPAASSISSDRLVMSYQLRASVCASEEWIEPRSQINIILCEGTCMLGTIGANIPSKSLAIMELASIWIGAARTAARSSVKAKEMNLVFIVRLMGKSKYGLR